MQLDWEEVTLVSSLSNLALSRWRECFFIYFLTSHPSFTVNITSNCCSSVCVTCRPGGGFCCRWITFYVTSHYVGKKCSRVVRKLRLEHILFWQYWRGLRQFGLGIYVQTLIFILKKKIICEISRDGINHKNKVIISSQCSVLAACFFSIPMTVEQALKIPKSGACCFSWISCSKFILR